MDIFRLEDERKKRSAWTLVLKSSNLQFNPARTPTKLPALQRMKTPHDMHFCKTQELKHAQPKILHFAFRDQKQKRCVEQHEVAESAWTYKMLVCGSRLNYFSSLLAWAPYLPLCTEGRSAITLESSHFPWFVVLFTAPAWQNTKAA